MADASEENDEAELVPSNALPARRVLNVCCPPLFLGRRLRGVRLLRERRYWFLELRWPYRGCVAFARVQPDSSCWWCGAPAASAEHKQKRSDLIREFGPAPWANGGMELRRTDGTHTRFAGPNSKVVKFEKTLCARCNNQRSQPFDLAYDTFIKHVQEHEHKVVRNGRVDLREVYGEAWEDGSKDLRRYFAKHVGCRLAHDGIEIVPAFLAELDERPRTGCLSILCSIQMEFTITVPAVQPGRHGFPFVGIGDIDGLMDRRGRLSDVNSFLQYRWLIVGWMYAARARPRWPDAFDSPVVELPKHHVTS